MSAFLELCGKATPGKWTLVGTHPSQQENDGWGVFENFFVCREDGTSLARVRSNCDHFKQSEITANADLIARCSPDTMKRVYEALEYVRDKMGSYVKGDEELTPVAINYMFNDAIEAFHLLDGRPVFSPV